ncbi:MAG: IS3 family transposase [Nitrospinae bacterium]|nr:IS3 family transposase [Nitrospinota bacterium]
MKFRLIQQERRWYGIDALCQVLGVTRGGYWSWVRRRPGPRRLADAVLLADIRQIYKAQRQVYGSPRIHDELQKQGVRCGRKRVERLMSENGIRAKQGKKYKPKTTDSRHNLPVAQNILNRQFARERPNEAWVTDITYIPTREGWLYLAAIMDLFSRRIVGWSMGSHIDRHLPLRALQMAVQNRRPRPGLIHHSDRGSQYASGDYQTALKQHGMVCSMSRKGNCWDNAPMESWFHTLKSELIQDLTFNTRREAIAGIFEYMEVFYNRQRIHSALDRLTPSEHEELFFRRGA